MGIRIKYRYRLLFYFVILLVFVALAFTVYMYRQNRSYSLSTLQLELKNYSSYIFDNIKRQTKPSDNDRINFTILDTSGFVIFDSMEQKESFVFDQSEFYEVVKAKQVGEGSTLRTSNTDENVEYLYYAKKYDDLIIKTYIVFNTLEPAQIEKDNKYFLIIALLLVALIVAAFFISKKLVKPLKSYTQLTEAIKNNENLQEVSFDNDDFGAVGQEIADTFVQLDRAKRYKQQLTQNIAHELKTPVTAIKAYLETILQDNSMPEEQKLRFIKNSYNQAVRLADLVSEVSILNKLDEAISMKGEQKIYAIEEVNFASCIDNILDEIGYKFEPNGIDFSCNIDPSLSIMGSKSLIYSLFKNLIDNSVEHSGGGCAINIDGRRLKDEDGAEFEYYDTGAGIPQENLERVFERFYRVSAGRTRKEGNAGGSGLGLSIVKNAVTFHKGNITVHNREEGGVIFKFTLLSLS